MFKKNLTVALRGGGDIATGIAHRLHKAGIRVVVLEIEKPTVIRRSVSLAESVYEGEIEIEGVRGKLVKDFNEAVKTLEDDAIPVMVDPYGKVIKDEHFQVVVDAILAKKNIGTTKDMAPLVIGVGPGFTAGSDVDAVVESNRGHYLGKVILGGRAEENTGIPGSVLGLTEERVIRATNNGIMEVLKDIGTIVNEGDIVGIIDGVEVRAKIGGVVRGIIKNGLYVDSAMKIGDVDPRGIIEHCYTISDKARAIGGGVLEVICYFHQRR